MGVRPIVTVLAMAATFPSVLEAAPGQFAQAPGTPRLQIQQRQRPQPPLFPVPPLAQDRAPSPPASPNQAEPLIVKPRVVCGMTLIPMAPQIDPKIAQKREPQKPKNPTTYTIRPVQPSICW